MALWAGAALIGSWAGKAMRYIEAPEEYAGLRPSLFLAGGIVGCPAWQQEFVRLLADTDLVLLNPRRRAFPIADPAAAPQQIVWEHRHLRRATAIAFWFPFESLCPIALYELGAWSMTDKAMCVGTHPDYRRRQDVTEQTRLARPEVPVVSSVAALAGQVRLVTQTVPPAVQSQHRVAYTP